MPLFLRALLKLMCGGGSATPRQMLPEHLREVQSKVIKNAQNAQPPKRFRANMSRIEKERCNHVRVRESRVSRDGPYRQAGEFCLQPHKSFGMRRYEKCARKPFGIRRYKFIGLKVL